MSHGGPGNVRRPYAYWRPSSQRKIIVETAQKKEAQDTEHPASILLLQGAVPAKSKSRVQNDLFQYCQKRLRLVSIWRRENSYVYEAIVLKESYADWFAIANAE